jgi:hypothetical protein
MGIIWEIYYRGMEPFYELMIILELNIEKFLFKYKFVQ